MIYLDFAATTPMREEVLNVYDDVAKQLYGNASSLHDIGTKADHALTQCREQIAELMNGQREGVYFTSGGSEANILSVRSLLLGNREKGKHIITTEVEHASLYHLFQQLETEGYEVTFIGVDTNGQVQLDELRKVIREDTVLASIQYVNSETGVIQPIKEIGNILKQHQVIFHTDAVQAFGKIPLDVIAYQVDSVSVASHKIYGPKGVGACYIAPSVRWKSQYVGATHEGGFRMGTVDVPGVAAFTSAAALAKKEAKKEQARIHQLRDQLIRRLAHFKDNITVEGHPKNQLANIVGLSFKRVQGQHIMLECNRYGIAISTGSACQVGQQHPSRTMLATGKTTEEANSFVRLSLGLTTTEAEIDTVATTLEEIIAQI